MTTSGKQVIKNIDAVREKGVRLVMLATALPYPPTNGYTMRIWALLKCLAAEGCDTDFVCFGDPANVERYWKPLSQVCRTVEVVSHGEISLSGKLHFWRRLSALIFGLPYAVVRSRSELMKARISGLFESGDVDAVLMEETNLLENLPSDPAVPLILDHHNVEYLLLKRYVGHAENWFRATYAWLETRKVRRWEKEACSRASVVLACSSHDRSEFLSFGVKAPVILAPNVVDVDSYTPVYEDDGRTILYAGGMDWHPNRDAVEYFCQNILPHVRGRSPGVKFVVAGRSPSAEFRRRFAGVQNLAFTGTVSDMRNEIAKAAVCVVPLRVGSGTRLKIIEAAAMGKAIVSTRIGAEGLEFKDGTEIVLADDPEVFAQAVLNLLLDPDRRRTIGSAARRRVETCYGLPALRRSLQEALALLTPERPRGSRIRLGLHRVDR